MAGGLPHPLLIVEEAFHAAGLNVPGNVVNAWVVMVIMIVPMTVPMTQ